MPSSSSLLKAKGVDRTDHFPKSGGSETIGMYLLALRASRELMLGAGQLTDGVEWGTVASRSSAHRLVANLVASSTGASGPRSLPLSRPWRSAYLLQRLPEVCSYFAVFFLLSSQVFCIGL